MTASIRHEHFRKSSFSSENGQACVEIGCALDAVRDSKNPTGPTLHADLAPLLSAVKSGQFRH